MHPNIDYVTPEHVMIVASLCRESRGKVTPLVQFYLNLKYSIFYT